MGKTNCGNDELAFLASSIKEGRTSRRRRLKMQLAFNNRRWFLNLFCLLLLLIPKETSQFNCDEARPVRSCRRFLQDSFILSFSLKNMTRSTPPNCLSAFQPATLLSLSNMEHRIQKWFMHIKLVYFVLSKQEEHISSRSSRFVPKVQNKLCTHDKNGKHAELWVKINLFAVFVMYALGSVHEKFDV